MHFAKLVSTTNEQRLRCSLITFVFLTFFSVTTLAIAEIYQSPADFLSEVFAGNVPKSKVIWLTGNTGENVAQILQHKPKALRWRYWCKNGRSAWIGEEIGKEKPITVGISIHNDQIEKVRVLIFRESRGWEIHYPFFTKQFIGVRITDNHSLDKNIDSISGATLSVRAVTRLTQIALYLHHQVKDQANVTP